MYQTEKKIPGYLSTHRDPSRGCYACAARAMAPPKAPKLLWGTWYRVT